MKKVFSYNQDIDKTAFLNWRTEKHDHIGNMINLADGYFKAAIKLSEDLVLDNRRKDADVIIFPMLFSVNHGIELYLKVLMWEFNILLDIDEKFERHHNIQQLFNVVNKKMVVYETDKERRRTFRKRLSGLKEYIDELFEQISIDSNTRKDSMDFARYPFNMDYENHFYTSDYMNKVVDLENFYIRFSEIGTNLNNITSHYLYDQIQYDEE